MEKELETIISEFMLQIQDYEERSGVFVKLFRDASCHNGQMSVEIKKSFGLEFTKARLK